MLAPQTDLASAVTQIAAAVFRLSTAIDGVTRVETWMYGPQPRVDFCAESNAVVVAFCVALGMERRDVTSVCGSWRWLEGCVVVNGMEIRVTGPHTPVDQTEPAEPDVSQVAGAVEAAQAVTL